jgi:hypothetical protein
VGEGIRGEVRGEFGDGGAQTLVGGSKALAATGRSCPAWRAPARTAFQSASGRRGGGMGLPEPASSPQAGQEKEEELGWK